MELLHQSGDTIASRYRIIETLGEGGCGITYLAQDVQSGEQLAVKALSLHLMTDWKMLEQFEREARILKKLNHPAIPRYKDYFEVDIPNNRTFYIAQQLALGKSLAQLVQSGWRTTEKEVRRIAMQMLEILVYLHEFNPLVIHRDIKPQNIIRREDGQVFLVDFGAVQDTYHSTLVKSRTVVGTFGYMAPEQFRGQAVPTTDLYGLGATLLFLLTHRSPADLPTDGLRVNFRDRIQISSEFADWLEQMLEPDVEERFKSAKEAQCALRGMWMRSAKSSVLRKSVSLKALVGAGVATVTAVAVFSVFNSFKYPLLIFLEFEPKELCYTAAAWGDVEGVRYLLEQGVDVNTWYGDNFLRRADKYLTLLHAAGNKEVAQLLIDKGADVNAMNEEGQVPLDQAIMNNRKDVADLLKRHGARMSWCRVVGQVIDCSP